MSEIVTCPICKLLLDEKTTMQMGGIARINCPNCGRYQLAQQFHSDFIENNKLAAIDLATLSYAIRRMQRNELQPFIVQDLALNILQGTSLPTATEQIDNLLLFLGQTLQEPGHKIQNLIPSFMRATLGSITIAAASWIMEQAIELGLMQGTFIQSAGGAAPVLNVTLSIGGWQRFSELQSAISGSRRAFMAMKFGDTEMDSVFTQCFKPAAKRAGYDLVKLNDEPRAGLIDDRLRLEIRTSRFLIADLSHANNGAYWEAGYAEGLGRPVIYTCKESVFGHEDPNVRPHFDTNHYLIVPWNLNDLDNAANKLVATIRVTLPSEAKLTDD